MHNSPVRENGEAISQNKWYALYTKANWERKVSAELVKMGFEVYCPETKVYRKWSDRLKVLTQPLFRMYVFILVDEKRKWEPMSVPGIIKYVTIGNKPAVVRNDEIRLLKDFLQTNDSAEVVSIPTGYQSGEQVKVSRGIFIDQTGIVVHAGNNRVEVLLESLSCVVRAVFRPAQIERLKTT